MRFFLTKNAFFFASYGISQLMRADYPVELTNRRTMHPRVQP
jgi:hypothetical protein